MLAVARRLGRADSAKTATARRLDHEHVTGRDLGFGAAGQLLPPAVGAFDLIRLEPGDTFRMSVALDTPNGRVTLG